MHLKPEYSAELANKGGWLLIFICFSILSTLAFLRGAAASVVSGGVGGVEGLVLTFAMLLALIGLLLHKRWAYYLFLLIGVGLLFRLGIAIFAAPDLLMFMDWKFDMPIIFEWLLVLAWLIYFISSRRVYSVFFGAGTA